MSVGGRNYLAQATREGSKTRDGRRVQVWRWSVTERDAAGCFVADLREGYLHDASLRMLRDSAMSAIA